ncbi:PorP/SprF family type IX secretion system membrane protein [uncultured Croceitalea sp.]|uniref:PorP/SprF family type IX secretion system membrane protein n=1 Tax=uncultured Croceitalea sp. TaxID=1798908 RepID=UPI00330680FB
MKKHQLIFSLSIMVLGSIIKIAAQQTPVFTEYNYNPFLINSAYAGTYNEAEATLSNSGFNSQFPGTPKNFAFTFNTALDNGKMGLGAGVINDEIGVTSATQVFAAYSYKLFFDFKKNRPYWQLYDRTVLSFGITAGALLYNEDLLQLGIQDDPNFAENIDATLPAAGVGILFGHSNFFIGASMPNVIGDAFSNQDNLELSRPIYGYTGYYFSTSRFNDDFILKPSMLFKYESGAPFQVDLNMGISYKNSFEVGLGYRTSSSINFAAGFYIFKNFRALYNYTQTGGDAPIGNTHGIVLSYRGGLGYASR